MRNPSVAQPSAVAQGLVRDPRQLRMELQRSLAGGSRNRETLALTRRILYLVRVASVKPSRIMALTFTRAATTELRRRVRDELGSESTQVIIFTLHSYALRMILRYSSGERLPRPIRIADDYEERRIIEELHVEVKGTSSLGEKVILTGNEVKHATRKDAQVARAVVSGVLVEVGESGFELWGGKVRVFNPWSLDTASLEPLGYEYPVPDGPSPAWEIEAVEPEETPGV
jgi:UvrD/REP helicase N-terminal domain